MDQGPRHSETKPWMVEFCLSVFLFLIAGTLALNEVSTWWFFLVAGLLMSPTKKSF